MKIIDKLVIRSFLGPYILSFFVAEFVLIMQFLWKYIDEILGKGFSIFEILELIFYYGMTIVPMALPISILIASVMVFGDMAEKHELPTMKSAGVSLLRIMRGGLILAFLTFLFSIFASNYLKPTASFQFKKRFDIIRKQKSTLTIEEKIFNDDFSNYIIRVNSKNKDGRGMKDVLIYDHTKPDKSLINLISSDSAEMYSTENGRYFIMNLFDGYQYQEDNREKDKSGKIKYPFMKTHFDSYEKILDMSEFFLAEGDLSINRNKEDMLNTFQILKVLDSLKISKDEALEMVKYDYAEISSNGPTTTISNLVMLEEKEGLDSLKIDSLDNAASTLPLKQKIASRSRPNNFSEIKHLKAASLDTVSRFYEMLGREDLYKVINRAVSVASSRSDIAFTTNNRIEGVKRSRNAYLLRLNQQYSFATICLIFFFIGAPLGSIIRKGGYGYSLLVAILFYMVFIISSIVGEKLLKNGTLGGVVGAWLSCILLLPFGILFTHKALNDVKFDLGSRMTSFLSRFNSNKEKET